MGKRLNTNSEIKAFLEKYNYFHDALLSSVQFFSDDYFSGKPPALTITSQFNAAVSICHYNYQENQEQTIYSVLIKLHALGSFSLHSDDREQSARHWALTKIEIAPLKDRPERWLMTIKGEKLDEATEKWAKADLARIEFAYLTYRVLPYKNATL